MNLKAPTKPGDPTRYRDPHDRQQFERFKSLPVWAISNFASLRVFRRDELIDSIEIVPEAALNPDATDARAERLIRRGDPATLIAALTPLALADPPPAKDAEQLASNLAHAARLVRSIVADRLGELAEAKATGAPLQTVRDEFREVLYAHPQAAGYNAARFDPLFAAAFAQTLAFGLLLVREATDRAVDYDAWRHMPPEHSLMRTTLRVLSQEEIVADVGVGFDVILDTVNSFDPAILVRKTGKPDPILYFYEDFLQVFDPAARERYGVYFTPVKVVTYMVAALDRVLRENLGTTGLADDAVTLLDPASGTGTFLLGVIENVRASVESSCRAGSGSGSFARACVKTVRFRVARRPLCGRPLPTATQRRSFATQITVSACFLPTRSRDPALRRHWAAWALSPKTSARSGTRRIGSNSASQFWRSSAIRPTAGLRRGKSANLSATG